MKTLTNALPQSLYPEHFALPRNQKLVGRWQHGIETTSGRAQWKLHVTLAHSSLPVLARVNHSQQP